MSFFKVLRVSMIALLLALVLVGQASSAQELEDDNNVIRWAGCGITKKAFMSELAAAYTEKTHIKVVLEGGGATRGIRDTVALKIDMGGTCRMPLPEFNHSELFSTVYPVAWDALAVITNPDNPVKSFSTQQIKDIYLGKIKNWKQLGWIDAPINLYVRKSKISGVGYAIRQYIFQDGSIEFKTKYKVPSSGPLEKGIEKDPYGIGITGISSAKKRKVNIAEFDGRSPSFENVKSGNYGLYRPLYLVTGPSPSKKVQDFILFATSNEGREIIRESGTVPYRDALGLMSKMVIYGFGVK
ncbi:MAG: phosphate ABC transporter substrate-binding protein [Gammaproteobacteria bacterium]